MSDTDANAVPFLRDSKARREGYLAGRLLLAALDKAGPEIDPERLINAIEALSNLDFGGIKLSFSAASHQGSTIVFPTRVEGNQAKEAK